MPIILNTPLPTPDSHPLWPSVSLLCRLTSLIDFMGELFNACSVLTMAFKFVNIRS